MSAGADGCPLGRGQYDSEAGLTNLLGRVYTMNDVPISTTQTASAPRTNHRVKVRVVRNSSGFALLPGRSVAFKAGTNMQEVAGYSRTTGAESAGIVDERLPSAGVPDGADFLIVVEGPSLVWNDIASGASTVITEGDLLIALTAATSGATTGGRLYKVDMTGATEVLGGNLNNVIGRALSSVTTANTNTKVLAYIKSRFC